MIDKNKIEESNENFSDEYARMMRQYIEKMQNNPTPNLKHEIDAEGGKIITPVPYCCIKTTDSTNQKIFINLTSHELIESPKEENILELNNQYGVRIPLSLAEKVEDFDAKMGICQVYDVIISTKMIEKCDKETLVFSFIYTLICNRIMEKFKHQLSEKFKKLKNLKYKGKTIRTQRVRVRKGPKIEEVLDNSNIIKESNLKLSQDSCQINREQAKSPEWNFFILKKKILQNKNHSSKDLSIKDISLLFDNSKELLNNKNSEKIINFIDLFDGYNCSPKYGTGLVFLLSFPLISKSFGISLNVSDEGFICTCGKMYQIKLSFPYRVNSSKGESIFDTITRTMLLILPFYNTDIQEQLTLREEENIKSKKIVMSTPNLTDNYLFDVL